MNALKFYKLSLVLNIIGIGLPVLLYLDIHGIDPAIIENLGYSILVAVIMFFWTKKNIENNPLVAILERPDTVMDRTLIEKRMVAVVLLLPIIFGAIAFAAIGYFENGLARTGWMLISMSVGVGIHLEAILRLSRSE